MPTRPVRAAVPGPPMQSSPPREAQGQLQADRDPSHAGVSVASLAAGALARATSASVLYPTEVLKTRLQYHGVASATLRADAATHNYEGVAQAFGTILRNEGSLGFYRGLGTRLLYITPSAAVSFSIYELVKHTVHQAGQGTVSVWAPLVPLLGGVGARVFGTMVRTPFDIVAQRQQTQYAYGQSAAATSSPAQAAQGAGQPLQTPAAAHGQSRAGLAPMRRFPKYVPTSVAAAVAVRNKGVISVPTAAPSGTGTVVGGSAPPASPASGPSTGAREHNAAGANRQGRRANGALAIAREVVQTRGMRGLWRGASITLVRDLPFAGIYFSSYELLKNVLIRKTAEFRPHHKESGRASHAPHYLLAGALAGSLASACTIPVDVVKTRIQTSYALHGPDVPPPYSGVLDGLACIARKEGVRGLFSGLSARLLHIIPAASLTFACYEYYKKRIFDWLELHPSNQSINQ